jgi:hypothetical protein
VAAETNDPWAIDKLETLSWNRKPTKQSSPLPTTTLHPSQIKRMPVKQFHDRLIQIVNDHTNESSISTSNAQTENTPSIFVELTGPMMPIPTSMPAAKPLSVPVWYGGYNNIRALLSLASGYRWRRFSEFTHQSEINNNNLTQNIDNDNTPIPSPLSSATPNNNSLIFGQHAMVIRYYERAASLGSVDACYALGRLVDPHGPNSITIATRRWNIPSTDASVEYFLRAANQGHVSSMLALGDIAAHMAVIARNNTTDLEEGRQQYAKWKAKARHWWSHARDHAKYMMTSTEVKLREEASRRMASLPFTLISHSAVSDTSS